MPWTPSSNISQASGTTDLTLTNAQQDIPSLTVTRVTSAGFVVVFGQVYLFDNGNGGAVNAQVFLDVSGATTLSVFVGFGQVALTATRRLGITMVTPVTVNNGSNTFKYRALEGSNLNGTIGGAFVNSRLLVMETGLT